MYSLLRFHRASNHYPHFLPLVMITRQYAFVKRRIPTSAGVHHGKQEIPEIDSIVRQFMKRVHPDRFIKHPSQRHHNEVAVQEFLGFLDELKCVQQRDDADNMLSPYPPRRRQRFEFFISGEKHGEFRKVGVSILTTGGDCRNVVQHALEDLFSQSGIKQTKFHWGKKYWMPRTFDDHVEI